MLYNILLEFGVTMKSVGLIKVYLNDTYSKVSLDIYLSDSFSIQNILKHGDALSPLLFKFVLEYSIRNVQGNQVGLKLIGTYQLRVYFENVNLLGDNINIIKKKHRP
jgi:hypothetical protein